MADYGVTDEGFKNKPLSVILEEMEDEFKSVFGIDLNTSIESPEGQIIDVVSTKVKALWNVAEKAYGAFSPSLSSVTTLDNICKINNVLRDDATYTTVSVVFTGDDGTVIPAGTIIATSALLTGETEVEFSTESDVAISGTTIEVLAIAIESGALQAPVASVVIIKNPIVGIDSVINNEVGNIGREAETDPELRAKREILVASPAVSTTDAIAAGIRLIDTVKSVVVLENESALPATIEGVLMDAHSVKAIVQGAETVEENTAIATAMYDRKDPGIPTTGTESEVVVDTQGFDHSIYWDTPTLVPIYVTILTDASDDSFPSDGQDIKDAIVDYMNDPSTGSVIGKDVSFGRLFTPVNSVPDHFVQTMFIGKTASPTLPEDVEILGGELATFTQANIIVTVNYT